MNENLQAMVDFFTSTEMIEATLIGYREAQPLVDAWNAYKAHYLVKLSTEEASRIYNLAHQECALKGKPPNIKELGLDEFESLGDLFEHFTKVQAGYIKAVREFEQRVIDRLWEAGYVTSKVDSEEDITEKLMGNLHMWQVDKGAPYPPETSPAIGRSNPSPSLKLGSRPYSPSEKAPNYPDSLRPILTAPPYMFIDRAARDGRNWEHNPTLDPFPFYTDRRTEGMRLSYHPTGDMTNDFQTLAALAVEEVSKLDDRTADVWRCVLWKAMENGPSADNVYGRIRIDTREIAQLLGYKKHHKGGMKPEHLLEVQQALSHFERLRLYMDPSTTGTLERDTGQAKGKRKRLPLQKAREERVIAVMAREAERDLYGQTYHMVWEIALGDWARLFPRSYAPMVRALVELPAKGAKAKWAKRIGTGLMLHYREDAKNGRGMKRMKWSTLLDRAQLTKEVEELRASRNTARVKTYAVAALDLLQEIGVLERWQEAESYLARTNDGNGKPGNFDRWLESVVEIHAPADVLSVLETISPPKPKGTGRPQKSGGKGD